jgi:hypothetical protein
MLATIRMLRFRASGSSPLPHPGQRPATLLRPRREGGLADPDDARPRAAPDRK